MANCGDTGSTTVLRDAYFLLDGLEVRLKAALGHCSEVYSRCLYQSIPLSHQLIALLHLKGLSGRTLRRLPAVALALYTESDPCSLDDALAALSRAVDDEFTVKRVCETLI